MVYYAAGEVRKLFTDTLMHSSQMRCIAEDDDGISIFLYSEYELPKLVVMCDGSPIDCMNVSTLETQELEDAVSELYKVYTMSAAGSKETEDGKIEEREQELTDAMVDFLSVVYESNIANTEKRFKDIIPEIIDNLMEFLYRKHNISVYRPMYLEDENGEAFFEEYPYECMEFEN